MTKVYQTNFTKENGDCLQAAVASLLDIEQLADVPAFSPFEWQRALSRYLFDHHQKRVAGVQIIDRAHLRSIMEVTLDTICLASVESFAHENCLHAVVAQVKNKELTIIHDPNPANGKRKSYEYVVWELLLIF